MLHVLGVDHVEWVELSHGGKLVHQLPVWIQVRQDLEVVHIEQLVPDVVVTWKSVDIARVDMHGDAFVEEEVVWDLVLRQSLQIEEDSEVPVDL